MFNASKGYYSLVKESYMVAIRITNYKKPYNIGECLIKPSLFNVTSKFLGSSAAKLIIY